MRKPTPLMTPAVTASPEVMKPSPIDPVRELPKLVPAEQPVVVPAAKALDVQPSRDPLGVPQPIVVEKTGPHPLVAPSEIAAKLRQPISNLGAAKQLLTEEKPTPDTRDTRAKAPVEATRMGRPVEGAAAAPRHGAKATLVVVVEDGSDGKAFDLRSAESLIGRTEGEILLFDDPFVSPRHAQVEERDGKWFIRDLDSLNHVYLRARGRRTLSNGDLILLGSQVLEFQLVSEDERRETPAMQHGTRVFGSKPVQRIARLLQRTVAGLVGDVYHLHRDETVLGREVGDIVFTADAFLSRRHAAVRRDPAGGGFTIEDLDSSNGTYLAIRKEASLSSNDKLRIGQHLFRFETRS